MTFREWLRASAEPGPVGRLHFGMRHRVKPSRNDAIWRGCAGLGLLVAWVLFMSVQSLDFGGYALAALLTVMYLVVGFFVHPAPEDSNMGWGDGMFDNPFRFSDGFNRFLFTLRLVLWPGRFVAECLADIGEFAADKLSKPPGLGRQ